MKTVAIELPDSSYSGLDIQARAAGHRSVTAYIEAQAQRGFKAETLVTLKVSRVAHAALARHLLLVVNRDYSQRPVSMSEYVSCLILESTK